MAGGGIRRSVAGLMSGLVVGLGACATVPQATGTDAVEAIEAALTGPAASAEDVDQVAASLNEFAVSLYSELHARGQGQPNLVLSPASVAQVLTLLLAATDGTAHEQLRDVLHLTVPDDRLYPAVAALWRDLTSGEHTLETANWGLVKETVTLNPDYVSLVAEHLGARFQADTFADPEALADRINLEVSARTHDMIPTLVEPSMVDDPNLFLVLLNAVYFQGDWATPFAEGSTEWAPFTRADGSRTSVSMMSRPDVTDYVEADAYTAVEMAYRGSASMVLVLPDPDRFEQVADALDAQMLTQIRSSLATAGGQAPRELRLPRFDVTADKALDLKDTIAVLGAPALFSESWDWTPLQTPPEQQAEVSFLVHKAAILVGEEGTEAAGATGAGVRLTSLAPVGPITFDRPFLFSIVDDTHGVVLFHGHIGDPVGS